MKKTLLALMFLTGTSVGLADDKKLVCKQYVINDIEFCTVTLTILENGNLESPANINHQGSNQKTVIKEIDLQDGDLYRLLLDADRPGNEIEMIISSLKNEKDSYPSVLINHQAPFAKEMHGSCVESLSSDKVPTPTNRVLIERSKNI